MALSSSRLATAIKDGMETAFGLVSIPGYDSAEMQKFADVIAGTVVSEITGNAELSSASLDDATVSGTTDTTDPTSSTKSLDNGQVDDTTVSGGIS